MDYGHAIVSWLTLFGLAFLIDLLLGSPALLGKLPGPDDLIARVAALLETRLNRPQRSATERRVRGLIVLLALIPALAWVGGWLNKLVASGPNGMAVGALLLTLMVRQRRGWDKAIMDARKSAADPQSERHYSAARRGAERLVFAFSETVVAGLTLFAAGGFAFFLPFRFLAILVAQGAPEGAGRPSGPFYAAASFFYSLTTLPAAALSALALAMSPLLLPGTKAVAIRGMTAPITDRLPVRLWPLAVVAEGMTLAFDSGAALKKDDTTPRWIGPRDGRARLNAMDIVQVGRMVLVAEALILLIIMMATSFFLTGGL